MGVVASVRSMQLLGGGTYFEGPLRKCQQMLDQYTVAGQNAFDLCILVTDGGAEESVAQLQAMRLLNSKTKLMGIYVGQNATHRAKLRALTSCTASTTQQCPYFESAADFDLLRSRAGDLAAGVTTGLTSEVTEKKITYDCKTPIWTLGSLVLWVPLVVWWCYLHANCPKRGPTAATK